MRGVSNVISMGSDDKLDIGQIAMKTTSVREFAMQIDSYGDNTHYGSTRWIFNVLAVVAYKFYRTLFLL